MKYNSYGKLVYWGSDKQWSSPQMPALTDSSGNGGVGRIAQLWFLVKLDRLLQISRRIVPPGRDSPTRYVRTGVKGLVPRLQRRQSVISGFDEGHGSATRRSWARPVDGKRVSRNVPAVITPSGRRP